MLDEEQDEQAQQDDLSTWKTSTARIPWSWAVRNFVQERSARRGAGSTPARCKISQTVETADLPAQVEQFAMDPAILHPAGLIYSLLQVKRYIGTR
ncbi:hypothetical protein [Streptomyces sp. NPDC056713]|uniref:hypothetical protein n=1 Tax=Streptomyces sp. NPDC056713 TaxID=3345921 RepID=UPI0036BEEA00